MDLRTLRFADDGEVPNNPDLPVLIYAAALPVGADAIEGIFRSNGWTGLWVYTVFDYHHYHPASHEALGVAAGHAELLLGGARGERIAVTAGDALLLPAGTGHKCLTASADFAVVGAYPPGQSSPEIIRAPVGRLESHLTAIRGTPLPRTDPVTGGNGPADDFWRRAQS